MTEKDIRNLKSSTASTIHSEKDISFLEDENSSNIYEFPYYDKYLCV